MSKVKKEEMKKQKICPKCKSKNLSDGKSDFIYSELTGETLIQFCNNCHEEWLID